MYVDYKEVGKRIAKRRKELGLKQFQVNELAGLSDKYLSNLERATSVPSVDVIMRLCSALQTTPNYLLLGAVNEYNESEFDAAALTLIHSMNDLQKKFALSMLEWISYQNI